MKYTSKLLVAVTVTVLMMILTGFACADTDEDFEYEIVNGEVAITLYKGDSRILEIPAFIDGMPVTKIEKMAFFGSDITGAVIPHTVRYIGE